MTGLAVERLSDFNLKSDSKQIWSDFHRDFLQLDDVDDSTTAILRICAYLNVIKISDFTTLHINSKHKLLIQLRGLAKML